MLTVEIIHRELVIYITTFYNPLITTKCQSSVSS